MLGIFFLASRYSTPDQGFPLCHSHHSAGLASCSNLTVTETRLYPMATYLFWQSYYIILVWHASSNGWSLCLELSFIVELISHLVFPD